MKETDLYDHVRDHFAAQGYTVQGEVRKCDIAAEKDGHLVAVEMKLRLNAEVITQAARRQQLADEVYIAIPKPKALAPWRKRASHLLYLVRRLEIGLLLVSPRARKKSKVGVEIPVAIFDRVKDGKLRAAVMRELRKRGGDFNVGGSVKTKLVSANRETAIHIAVCLEHAGPSTIQELHRLGTGLHTRSVLAASETIERWFREQADGRYTLSKRGLSALAEFAEVADHYRAQLDPGDSGE